MKLFRLVAGLLIIVILALLAWQLLPAGRERVKDVYEKYGGWTEEARQSDPVGFIEYAQKQSAADLEAMKETQRNLADSAQKIDSMLQEQKKLLSTADTLANRFRETYQEAEGDAGYPVKVAGEEYTRNELTEQVRLVLRQKRDYAQTITELEEAARAVKEKQKQLTSQINNTEAALATLPSKKEIARVNQLTGRTEKLLQQVGDVLEENREVMQESPVRTVEEIVQREKEETSEGDIDVQEFLEGQQ